MLREGAGKKGIYEKSKMKVVVNKKIDAPTMVRIILIMLYLTSHDDETHFVIV